jgi:hypothetical protein
MDSSFFFWGHPVYDDLTKEERETQKKLRELAREERDRGKSVKMGYRKIQINGDWFRWDENFLEEGKNKKTTRRENVQGEGE